MTKKRPTRENKRISCGRCGRVWTSRAPLGGMACPTCGRDHKGELEAEVTEHERTVLKGGGVVWSGPLGNLRFYLIEYPDGRIVAAVK